MKYTFNINCSKYLVNQRALTKRWRNQRQHWTECIQSELGELCEVSDNWCNESERAVVCRVTNKKGRIIEIK